MNKVHTIIKITFFMSALFLFSTKLHANQPPCEVWNYDTDQCETFAEQDISVNKEWAEFVASTKEWTNEEVQEYLNK